MRSETRRRMPAHEIQSELNQKLPADIAIVELQEAPARFHARHDAISRRYVYQISTKKSAFNKRYVWWIKDPLDVPAMAEAARALIGRHDFACFRAPDPSRPTESTIVVVDSASVEIEGDMVLIRVEASHFLWRMVRRLVGVLVKLGRGEINRASFDQLLDAKCSPDLDVAAWTAPAAGLFLEEIRYR